MIEPPCIPLAMDAGWMQQQLQATQFGNGLVSTRSSMASLAFLIKSLMDGCECCEAEAINRQKPIECKSSLTKVPPCQDAAFDYRCYNGLMSIFLIGLKLLVVSTSPVETELLMFTT